MNTTTLRISEETRKMLQKLKEEKNTPMSNIIHDLAEQEIKNIIKVKEYVYGKNSNK